jgi:hypothetical protein
MLVEICWHPCLSTQEYQQCLKSRCRLEQRQLRTAERLIRLLGLLAPMAVRLLHLRNLARRTPDRLAQEAIEPTAVAIIAARAAGTLEEMTCNGFWKAVAALGS